MPRVTLPRTFFLHPLIPITLAVGLGGVSHPLMGQSVFVAGAESKAAGMESGLRADGPPSLLYNPANLSRGYGDQWSQPYLEVGVYRVNYLYEHPDYDPVVVSSTSPTATLGYGYRLHEKVTFGVLLYPETISEMNVPALPRNIDGKVVAVESQYSDMVVHGGAGAAFDLGNGAAVGLSMIGTYEDHRRAMILGGQTDPVANANYRNLFYRPNLGVRYIPQTGLRTALSVRPPQTKNYRGSQLERGADVPTNPRLVDYRPTTFNAGIGANIKPITVNLEAQHEMWKAGESVYKNNLLNDTSRADLKNITQISTSMGYRFTKFHVVSLGYAHLPSPWGEGQGNRPDTGAESDGVEFAQLNGVTLDVLSLGGRWKVAGYDLSFSLAKAQGSREILSNPENQGFYYVDINTLSSGVKRSF